MRFFYILFLITNALFAQNQYPKDYFQSPMEIPIQLSGNFGELRNNHFHTGFDVKTQQREGLKIFAMADGYVSKVRISPYGYGKCIQITHPNGYTTLYAHLQKGAGIVEDYIKKLHYKYETFDLDIDLKPEDLPIKKGDFIAYSGNSGGSKGPHLHFEIRDSKTNKAINPMLFGFNTQVADTLKPVFTNLMVYPIDENSVAYQSQNPSQVNFTRLNEGNYLADKVYAKGKIGFAISTFDYMQTDFNKNGIYKIETFLNGSPYYNFQFDSFGFDESRMINGYIDYLRYKHTGQRMQKLFMKNRYSFTPFQLNPPHNGIIEPKPNVTQLFRIEISDFNQNKTSINIPVYYEFYPILDSLKVNKTPYYIKANKEYIFEKDNFKVTIADDTFYDDFYLEFDVRNRSLYLHDDQVPVNGNFKVTYKSTGIQEHNKPYYFLASIDNGRFHYNPTKYFGDFYTTYTKNLGQFKLVMDDTAPRIRPLQEIEGQSFDDERYLRFHIHDDLSGIKNYDVYINGKWALFEHDYKTGTITHDFEEQIHTDGKNEIQVIVVDNVGNSRCYESYFYKSLKKTNSNLENQK